MKQKLLLIILFACMFSMAAFAQSVRISGRVTTSANVPLPGTNIAVKGTSQGVISDDDGKFSITVASKATLIISHVGFSTKQVPVKGQANIMVSLDSATREMDNVVVIGYQTASRKSVSTSISSVSAKDIESYTTGNVANALQGKVPGLQVVSGGGLPGSQPKILIHGLSSINYNNNPLIIVDGVESDFNSLNFINPSDIATIDVLEDASAAAIYGARGGQGVIVVTTKRGRGNAKFNVGGSIGFDQAPRIKLANASEYARIMNQEAQASGSALPFADLSKVQNTDYWKNTFDVGRTQNYMVSVTGGKNGLSLYGSLGYYRSDSYNATDKGGYWQKYTARFNLDLEVNKAVKVGFSLAPRYENWLNSPNNIYAAYSMDPTTAPFKSTDSVYRAVAASGVKMNYTAFNPYYSQPNRSSFNGITNPSFNYLTNFGRNDFFGTQYGTYLQITPIKGLVIKTSLEGFVNVGQANGYTPKYFLAPNSYNLNSSLSSSTSLDTRWKVTNTVNYKLSIGDHSIDILAGQSADKYMVKGTSASRSDTTAIPLDDPSSQYISAASGTITGGSGSYQPGAAPWGNMVSYFGSLRYNYQQKYFLAGTFRADASSLVNPLYRWGYFPTVSGAWVLSEESFMKTVRSVNYLKLRASWGKSGGNLPPSSGAYLTVLGPTTYPSGTGGVVSGFAPNTIANPQIRWEVQKDYTIGVDATLLDNKLNFTAERYVRNPSNLLENINVNPILGYPQGYIASQLANVAKMTTKGWDLSVGYKDNITQKLHFNVNFTLSHYKSVVDDLAGMDPIIGREANDVISTGRSRITHGHEPGAWYGFVTEGVFQTDAEAAAYVNKNGTRLQPKAKAGDLKYKNINGDTLLDNNDLTDLGSPWPKYTGNFTLSVNYGRWDLRTEFYGSFGAKYFQSYRLNMNPTGHLNFESGLADKFWTGEGTSNKYPILRYPDQNGNFSKMSDMFLATSNFVRCSLLQVGYTFPNWIKGLNNARLYVSAQNLFTVTKYPGMNPDLPWYSSVTYNGVDNYQAPLARTFLIGLNFNL